uniref:Uncharacterized protein n=1 Tax=Anguilla anguilla TaxID=7936 RepID=A0A0E9VYX7_ANGAN
MFSLKNMHYIPYLVMVIGTYTSIYKILARPKSKKNHCPNLSLTC